MRGSTVIRLRPCMISSTPPPPIFSLSPENQSMYRRCHPYGHPSTILKNKSPQRLFVLIIGCIVGMRRYMVIRLRPCMTVITTIPPPNAVWSGDEAVRVLLVFSVFVLHPYSLLLFYVFHVCTLLELPQYLDVFCFFLSSRASWVSVSMTYVRRPEVVNVKRQYVTSRTATINTAVW